MLRLAIPLVLAELGWMTMSIVDTMMVGRQADSAVAIGAVSLGSMVYYVVAIFGTGLMLGLDTLVSHSYGAGDIEDAHRSLVNGVYLSFGMAPILMGLVRLWEPILRALDIQQSVLSQSIPYLRALNWSTLSTAALFCLPPIPSGDQSGEAGDVLIGHRESGEPAGQLGIYLRPSWALARWGRSGQDGPRVRARIYMAAVLLAYCVYYDLRYKTGLRDASRWPHMQRVWRLLTLGFPAAMQLGLEVGVFAAATALIARARSGPARQSSNRVEHSESYVHGAAGDQLCGCGARGTSTRAERSAWREPGGLDRDTLGAGFMSCTALVFWLVPRVHRAAFIPLIRW